MAQKVIIVSSGAATETILEKEFPKLQKALDEGYQIIKSEPVPLAGSVSASYYVVMFILEKE